MHSRFLTNAALATVGAFVVVASMSWDALTFQWMMLGGGVAAVVFAAAAALPHRGLTQRGLDGGIAVLGAWAIVASMAFSGLNVTWIGFGAGIAMFGLALAGLALHELSSEHVVHSIEVHAQSGDRAYKQSPTEELAALTH